MDAATLYVVMTLASGAQSTLREVRYETMRECEANILPMQGRDWNEPRRGARVDVFCSYPPYGIIAR